MYRIALIAGFIATPLCAEMTGDEFAAYVTGKTLTFSENGEVYGAEEYLPGNRVRWSYLDGECLNGVWYEQGPNICFVYEDDIEPQCWIFTLRNNSLEALFSTGEDATELYETEKSDKPLYCLGPDVGV